MEYTNKFQNPCQIEAKRLLFVVGIVAVTHLLCQSLILPYGDALLSLVHDYEIPTRSKDSIAARDSSTKSVMVSDSILVHASERTDTSMFVGVVKDAGNSNSEDEIRHDNGPNVAERYINNEFASDVRDPKNVVDVVEKGNLYNDSQSERDMEKSSALEEIVKNQDNVSILEKVNETRDGFFLEQIVKSNHNISEEIILEADPSLTSNQFGKMMTAFESPPLGLALETPLINTTSLKNSTTERTSISSAPHFRFYVGEQAKVLAPGENENLALVENDLDTPNNNTAQSNSSKKKMRCPMPPKSITSIHEMNRILVRNRITSRSMRPRWSSARDREILAAKLQIVNACTEKNDGELYAPLFRNVSMFRRSYELMERTLKIYIYKDGEKPIFHQPILKGLYASEGWFMKLMKGNKRFVVKDPRKAHLFYMPFSSRMLEYSLYVRNSHNRSNLREYLKRYSEKIAAKYPFWNRTGGADHFLVACHDWAPYETRHHMEHCIKALCNADVTTGFKIGRDVSLPETYVRSARNPLRDLGGKPPHERHILAFFAGHMHGYLRPILRKYWENKDPDMKIFGPMPPGVASKMNYIRYMKSSKYCICPKGYEVNSPRVVEAIFYECVPVIISDNFVPPFFGVLDWGGFSVLVAEKDIPNLKNILLLITEEKYLEMQLGVKKVQQHFLWHAKPMKYDLFHMTLHSIWYNRVFQTKLR